MPGLKPDILTSRRLAQLCLAYLAENPEQLVDFMGLSGLSPDDLRRGAANGEFDHGLIDYVAANEPLLLAVCANNAITPESVMRVWAKLNPAG